MTPPNVPLPLLVLPRGPDREIRLTIGPWQGERRADLRAWVRTRTGWAPLKQGVSLHPEELPLVVEALARVEAAP